MLPICVRPVKVWPKLSSIQGIRVNLVYIVSLPKPDINQSKLTVCTDCVKLVLMKQLESAKLHNKSKASINTKL